jgi:hypothetical protein
MTVLGFKSLSRLAIRLPKRMLLLFAALMPAAVPEMFRLMLCTGGHALVSPNAPEVCFDQSIRDQFGIHGEMIVVVRGTPPDGIFNPRANPARARLDGEFSEAAKR